MFRNTLALLSVLLCFTFRSWTHAGFESARVFPASSKVWLQFPDGQVAKNALSDGSIKSLFDKVATSSQWTNLFRTMQLDNRSAYQLTGLTIVELMEMLEGELAFGLFEEDDTNKWCLFLEPKSEFVALEILRSNLEKKLIERGYTRVEKRIGECYSYSWSKDDQCFIAYTIHNEKLLASNSFQQLIEMTTRWIENSNDGLISDPEFFSAKKSVNAEAEPSFNLFFRNQQIRLRLFVGPKNELDVTELSQPVISFLGKLESMEAYGLLEFFQSEVTSTFASLQIPTKSNGVEIALKVQVNTPAGDKLFQQPGKATLPNEAPFADFNVVGYSVLDADFWTASDYLMYLQLDESARELMAKAREKVLKLGGSEKDLVNKDSVHLRPRVFRCFLDDGTSAIVFQFRNLESSRKIYSQGRWNQSGDPLFGGKLSRTRTETSDGVYFTEVLNIPFELPASLAVAKSNGTVKPTVYGIRDEYFIICNSESFFRELPLRPEEPLIESVSYQMVKKKLDEQFAGNAFVLDYWDLPRIFEKSSQHFERSLFGFLLRVYGARDFDDLVRSLAEDLGPVGGAISKNKDGFRLDYIMLKRR